ncbi:MAG: hypothetical protein U0703_14000 [Anaerolineae bacterium]
MPNEIGCGHDSQQDEKTCVIEVNSSFMFMNQLHVSRLSVSCPNKQMAAPIFNG